MSQPDTCVPMEAVGDPHTVTVSMDSSEISMIINSIKEECFRSGVAEASGGSKAPSIDGKEDLDLAEKMDIAVSYTGEELDFETVGDIIAIIEDKVTIQQPKRISRGSYIGFSPQPLLASHSNNYINISVVPSPLVLMYIPSHPYVIALHMTDACPLIASTAWRKWREKLQIQAISVGANRIEVIWLLRLQQYMFYGTGR